MAKAKVSQAPRSGPDRDVEKDERGVGPAAVEPRPSSRVPQLKLDGHPACHDRGKEARCAKLEEARNARVRRPNERHLQQLVARLHMVVPAQNTRRSLAPHGSRWRAGYGGAARSRPHTGGSDRTAERGSVG